jgi:SAM-dependent methyltransferase
MKNDDVTDTEASPCVACLSRDVSPCLAIQQHDTLRHARILRCDRCGTGRTVTAASDADVHRLNEALYDGDETYSNRAYSPYYQQRNLDDATWILRRIGASRRPVSNRFLDIGCSGGGMMAAFASLGYDAWGVEPSSAYLHAPPSLAPKIQQCYFGDETFQQPFGLISAFHVLEHVPDPAAFLVHCHESLAPLGVLVIEVPNFDFALQRLNDDPDEATCQISPSYHINQFTARGLGILMRRTGFTVIRRDRVAPYRRPAASTPRAPSLQPPVAVSDAVSQPAGTLRSSVKQAVWNSRFLRTRVRHALAQTFGFGRYIRFIARADERDG